MKSDDFSTADASAIGLKRTLSRWTDLQKLRSSTWAVGGMRQLLRPSWTAAVEQRIFMALADEIRALRDRVLADLNDAHDYYTDTKIAWDIVRQVIAVGHTFSIRNMTTGTVSTQADLASK